MGKPNKGSTFGDKIVQNYGSADNLLGYEEGGNNYRYPLNKVAEYTLKNNEIKAGDETKTVAGHIESVKSAVNGVAGRVASLEGSMSTQSTSLSNVTSKANKNERDIVSLQTDMANNVAAITQMNNKVNTIESGPLVASTASQMTNHNKVYVYTGEELGYTTGDWYFYDGSRWVSGGPYNAIAVNLDKTLEVEGVAADSKAVGDALAALDDEKASIDGAYEAMTVGNAEQLVSTAFNEDSVPYNFRTAGGSADIGNRLYEKIVGGTVCWNQLLENGDFHDGTTAWSGTRGTITADNNVLSYKVTELGDRGIQNRITNNAAIPANHKVIISADYKPQHSHNVDAMLFGNDSVYLQKNLIALAPSGTWSRLASVCTITVAATQFWIGFNSTTGDVEVDDIDQIRNVQLIDLTQLFGPVVADYIYQLEQSEAGAGVAFFKRLFPKPYYEYNEGELMSVKTASHNTVGFNQWDEEWELGTLNSSDGTDIASSVSLRSKNYIPVIPGQVYSVSGPAKTSSMSNPDTWCAYDKEKRFVSSGTWTKQKPTTFTVPSNAYYIRFAYTYYLQAYGTYNHDICINLSWSGYRDGEYEPYVKHGYPLDPSLELRGIPKLSTSNELYYDGDTYEPDGTVTRRYGVVDLGTLKWMLSEQGFMVSSGIRVVTNRPASSSVLANIICSDFRTVTAISIYNGGNGIALHLNGEIRVRYDNMPTDTADFKAAMSGVMLVYELATPTTETAEPYQSPQIVDDFGTEEYVDTRDVAIPVGHETKYPANLRDKLQHLPDLADSDGYYMIQQVGHDMSLIRFRIPQAPQTDGTYTLKATVSGGTPTYFWEEVTEG